MKFMELYLERYGAYPRLSVIFSSPGLNVVYGSNEAGKSTCLTSISDFLFGIPNNSPHGQFGYSAMRIGATLLLTNGEQLVLRRRKGRGQTLLNENAAPIDESVLSKPLGAVTRDRFGALFGLDHRSLRAGGEALLSAEGDIGRLILQAGGGLRALLESVEGLGAEADSLFAPRSSERRKFYQLCGQLAAADRDVKDGILTFEAYQQAEKDFAEAEEKYRRLTENRTNMERQRSAVERACRVLPRLAHLNFLDREIEAYSDVSHLRPEFTAEVSGILAAREQAIRELNESARRCETLERQIGDLAVDEAVLATAAEIATIHEMSSHVANERQSRPNRERELQEQTAKLLRLRDYLKLETDADLKTYLPSADLREHVRRLITEGVSLTGELARLGKAADDNRSELQSVSETQQKLEEKGFNRSLAIDATLMKALPRLFRETEQRNSRAREIERGISRELTKWGFSNVAELREFQCPDLEIIEIEIELRKHIADQIKDHEAELRDANRKVSVAQRAIDHMHAAGEVPTDAAIARARLTRKQAWQPIRSTYLSDDAPALTSIPHSEREHNARRLDESIEDADHLADRKSAEAQRLTDLAAAEKQRDEANIEIEAATKALRQSESQYLRQVERFIQAWPQATRKESDLARLRLLVRQLGAILEQVEAAASLREEANARQIEADHALASLALAETDLGLHSASDLEIEKRLHDLERAANTHAEGHSEWLSNAARLETLERQLIRARGELDRLNARYSQWRQNWCLTMIQVNLPADSAMEFADQVLKEWSEARPALALIDNTQHRLDQFLRDEQELTDRIRKLSPQLSFELPDDPVAAAQMLWERRQTARDSNMQRGTLARQLKESKQDCEEKRRNADVLNGRVQNLCAEANSDNETSLKQIASHLSELLDKQSRRTEMLGQIHAASDGKPLEELRAECGGLDPDRAKAELEEIQTHKQHLDQEIQQAYAETLTRKAKLETFEAAAGINSVESRRQSAAAEMRAVIERYLAVKLARELLKQAIDRLRQERQDPLIARASEFFRLATRGSFVGIATDVDDHGNPAVVGKRTSGEQVHVNLMSDGTRDQLFLAFRLASIEHYCAVAEPLPFIADDLLVHFDDDRTAETIALLAELGRITQVLLFTHHRSVRDAAASLAIQGTARIVDLPLPAY